MGLSFSSKLKCTYFKLDEEVFHALAGLTYEFFLWTPCPTGINRKDAEDAEKELFWGPRKGPMKRRVR